MSNLFSRKLEKVSREIFERYSRALSKLVGSSYGVYALYDENALYYVGKASDLKQRIRQHLQDRHFAQWTHFSLFLMNESAYINDIESVVISITCPKGNKAKPKGSLDARLKRELEILVKKRQTEEIKRIFGSKTNRKKKRVKGVKRDVKVKAQSVLKNLFKRQRLLFKKYKGKEYKAILLTSGKIEYKNKLYTSPSKAAQKIIHSGQVNGWDFWRIQNEDGNWVKLSSLRKHETRIPSLCSAQAL